MKITKPVPFYEKGFRPYQLSEGDATVNLKNPYEIDKYLLSNVYKQDEYCKKAAMLLYNHVRGITSRMVVCGPPGNGKTYVAECIKKLWPNTIIINAATLSKDGWSGDNKVNSFLTMVNPEEQNCIVVYDEFDKCVCPHSNSSGENVSQSVQSEFLKLVEGQIMTMETPDRKKIQIDTSKMSFIFCGSFAQKAASIAEKNSEKTFGFGSGEHTEKAFERELNIKDMIEFGLIPELASRITDVVNVRPLSLKDYEYLLADHPGSPVKKIEKQYGIDIKISKKKLKSIAEDAYYSELGVRNATAKIKGLVDLKIYSSFEKGDDFPTAVNL